MRENERLNDLLQTVADLSLEVAKLSARVSELELHRAAGLPVEPTGTPDLELERYNRRMADGLANLWGYDGTPQEARADEE